MKLPCEQALWYTLPQIRADLTRELVKKGMSQREVAEILDITPSAVSQYLHKKRGGKVRMPITYKKNVVETAEKISETKNRDDVLKLICQCCMKSRPKSK